MVRIPLVDLATIGYVLVDDGYQAHGVSLLRGKVGAQPVVSDREVLTRLRLMDYRPDPVSGNSWTLAAPPTWPSCRNCWTSVSAIAVRAACVSL